jgi:hypothetical protein
MNRAALSSLAQVRLSFVFNRREIKVVHKFLQVLPTAHASGLSLDEVR